MDKKEYLQQTTPLQRKQNLLQAIKVIREKKEEQSEKKQESPKKEAQG